MTEMLPEMLNDLNQDLTQTQKPNYMPIIQKTLNTTIIPLIFVASLTLLLNHFMHKFWVTKSDHVNLATICEQVAKTTEATEKLIKELRPETKKEEFKAKNLDDYNAYNLDQLKHLPDVYNTLVDYVNYFITFDDIKLQSPEFLQKIDGILIDGAPGTGKSYLVKCFIGELKKHGIDFKYYEVGRADLVSSALGQTEKNITALFQKMKEDKFTILFIDEIESLINSRNNSNISTYDSQIINEFLIHLDQRTSCDKTTIVIGATNYKENIDSAITRADRLGKHIHITFNSTVENIITFLKGKSDYAQYANQDFIQEHNLLGRTPAEIGNFMRSYVFEELQNTASSNKNLLNKLPLQKETFEKY